MLKSMSLYSFTLFLFFNLWKKKKKINFPCCKSKWHRNFHSNWVQRHILFKSKMRNVFMCNKMSNFWYRSHRKNAFELAILLTIFFIELCIMLEMVMMQSVIPTRRLKMKKIVPLNHKKNHFFDFKLAFCEHFVFVTSKFKLAIKSFLYIN